jgi:hypothetical protein
MLIRVMSFFAALLLFVPSGPAFATDKPNVVYLLADDLGWGDLGVNGGSIPTPCLDRLFKDGVRLDKFMGWCVCSPTETSRVTTRLKKSPHRTSTSWPRRAYTSRTRTRRPPSARPLATPCSFNIAGPMLPDWKLVEVLPGLEKRAVEYIAKAAKTDKPFFLYLPLTSPHYPVVPAAKFKGKSKAGEYGDFVVQTDHVVGEVLDALKKCGVAAKTLVILTSDDNGKRGEPDWFRKNCGYKPHAEAGELFNLTQDPAQKDNRYGTEPEKVKELAALMERYVTQGRSTLGPKRQNDVDITWDKRAR